MQQVMLICEKENDNNNKQNKTTVKRLQTIHIFVVCYIHIVPDGVCTTKKPHRARPLITYETLMAPD